MTTGIGEWVARLRRGEVGATPTDSIPGLVCREQDQIYSLKGRDRAKKNILLIADLDQIGGEISDEFRSLAGRFWPGQLTIIYGGQGYRMPDVETLREVIRGTGPLWSSSANLSGGDILDPRGIRDVFGDRVFLMGDWSRTGSGKASTIYDLDNHRIIREGAISTDEILNFLGGRNRPWH